MQKTGSDKSATWLSMFTGGFDLSRISFSMRTAIGCCLALIIAWAMGLEHPQWAGMSVWAASQPMRGQLLEKSLFRFVGTVCGTLVGMVLVQASPLFLVIGLSLWVGVCTWGSNLQRGLTAYGFVLAGYSAAMVSLLASSQPDNVWHLGADRMATVLTGVVVATVIGYYFSKVGDEKAMRDPSLQLLSDILRHRAGQSSENVTANSLLNRLAEIDETLEQHGAGSFRARRTIRATRRLLLAIVPLLLRRSAVDAGQGCILLAAADALENGDVVKAQQALAQFSADASERPIIERIVAALYGLSDARAVSERSVMDNRNEWFAVHRDWIGAREAGLRAAVALLIVGMIWVLSGWSAGSYVMLGLSVMISVFSGFENPTWMMRHVFAGQCMAAIAALACHILFWPYAQTEFQQILMMMPFILAGVLLNGHNLTFVAAMDFHMVFLLLSQPHIPYVPNLQQSIYLSLAVISAPALAWGMYALIYPANVERRQQHVLRMMMNDLVALTKDVMTIEQRDIWEARFFHRVLRFIRLSHKRSSEDDKALTISRAILLVSQNTLDWKALANDAQTLPRQRKVFQQAIARIGHFENHAERSIRSLRSLAHYSTDPIKSSLIDASKAIEVLQASIGEPTDNDSMLNQDASQGV